MKKILIVGGGISGMTAAIYAARNGADVTLFEGNVVGGQIVLTDKVENYPAAASVSGAELAMNVYAQAESFGVKLVSEQVGAIDTDQLQITAGKVYHGDAVILAMGQSPKRLGLADEEKFIGRGISYCAVCDGMFYRGKTAIVVGGGNTAVQDAVHLSRLAKKVYLVHRRNEFRASTAETEKLRNSQNIEIVTPYVPHRILSQEGRLIGLEVAMRDGDKKSVLDADGIFLAIGYIPNTKLIASQIALSQNGYIIVDEHCRTNKPNVFACGDIVEKPLRQLTTATSDGTIAGHFSSIS